MLHSQKDEKENYRLSRRSVSIFSTLQKISRFYDSGCIYGSLKNGLSKGILSARRNEEKKGKREDETSESVILC